MDVEGSLGGDMTSIVVCRLPENEDRYCMSLMHIMTREFWYTAKVVPGVTQSGSKLPLT